MFDKFVVLLLAVLVIAFGVTVIYASVAGAEANRECTASGGVYLRTYSGTKCVYNITTKRPE